MRSHATPGSLQLSLVRYALQSRRFPMLEPGSRRRDALLRDPALRLYAVSASPLRSLRTELRMSAFSIDIAARANRGASLPVATASTTQIGKPNASSPMRSINTMKPVNLPYYILRERRLDAGMDDQLKKQVYLPEPDTVLRASARRMPASRIAALRISELPLCDERQLRRLSELGALEDSEKNVSELVRAFHRRGRGFGESIARARRQFRRTRSCRA